jgi:hypothetical protein
MFNRWKSRRNEDGQMLLIVIGIVAFTAILIFALQISVFGELQLASSSTSQEQALQAAQTGLSDYQARVNGSTNQWQYATAFCSSGVSTWSCASGQNPDPGNPAFSGTPDPHCTTSATNQTQGTAGSSNYFGWVTIHSDGGFVQQFQYVIDSSTVKAPDPLHPTLDPAGGGYAHVFVTGRSGRSSHFVCSTVKALYNGPQYTDANTTVLSPVLCNGSNGIITVPAPVIPLADPNQLAQVVITATGGNGATGGVGSGAGGTGLQGVNTTGGGSGGLGAAVQATFPATAGTTLYANIGCQGGSPSSTWQGGLGFSSGGSVGTAANPGNAGGGGGSTAVCLIPACYAGTSLNTVGLMASNVYLVAGGGGGGGEGRAFAAGNGGSGGTATTAGPPSPLLGVTNNGNGGSNSTFTTGGSPHNAGQGGAGGQGTASFTTANAAGSPGQLSTSSSDGGEDGGAGGGGIDGGASGTPGWGGGGGGAGSSFYNTLLAVSGSGTWTPVNPPPYGQVTIQWEDAAGNLVAPVVNPQVCGMAAERTSVVAADSTVSLQVIGGNGGQGSNIGKDPYNNGNALGGTGTGLTASYSNTSATPQDVTAIQGCPGAIATGGLVPTIGGFGLSSGANNYLSCNRVPCVADSGSGGGGAAICVGNVDPGNDTPSNNNCTSALPADILMLAAGGGGGGGASSFVSHLAGGAGGAAGIGTNWPGTTSSTQPQLGAVAGTAGGGGTGGTAGSTTYGTAPGAGITVPLLVCPDGSGGDGGAGGGGYSGGGGGLYGTTNNNCHKDTVSSGGGGGGSSYLATSAGHLSLTQCQPGVACMYSPCVANSPSPLVNNQPNTSSASLYEAEWCPGPSTTFGGASELVTVAESAPSILTQTPSAYGKTVW